MSGKKKKVGYFEDNEGNPSSIRVMSLIALIAAIGLAAAPFLGKSEGDPMHVFYFLLAAFAPKALQKMAEKK